MALATGSTSALDDQGIYLNSDQIDLTKVLAPPPALLSKPLPGVNPWNETGCRQAQSVASKTWPLKGMHLLHSGSPPQISAIR